MAQTRQAADMGCLLDSTEDVDSVRTVVRKKEHAFVIEIDKGEIPSLSPQSFDSVIFCLVCV